MDFILKLYEMVVIMTRKVPIDEALERTYECV